MSTAAVHRRGGTSTSQRQSRLITSTGIGSGLDIGAIVSSLTTAYGAAQNNQLNEPARPRWTRRSRPIGTFTSALDTCRRRCRRSRIRANWPASTPPWRTRPSRRRPRLPSAVGGPVFARGAKPRDRGDPHLQACGWPLPPVGTGTLTIAVGRRLHLDRHRFDRQHPGRHRRGDQFGRRTIPE